MFGFQKLRRYSNTSESGHFLRRIFIHGVLLYYSGMRSSLLLWLWTMRVCCGIMSNVRCKYEIWGRAECGNMNLGTLHPDRYPVNLPSLVYLDLDNNGLVALDDGVFRRVTRLRTLILRNNMLQMVPHSLFSDLYKLEDLDLSSNRLVFLTDERLFRSQNLLKSLDLSYNKLITIHQQVVLPLKNIQILKLAYNPFICDGELRLTMMWCDLRDIDTLATCSSPCVYSGLSWKLLKAADNHKNMQIPNVLNTTDGATILEMQQNRFEMTLLIAGICVALILIWCSVVGLYVWNKLSNRCRKGRENSIYDEATPNVDYYYEYIKSPTEKNKKITFPKFFPRKSSVTTTSNEV